MNVADVSVDSIVAAAESKSGLSAPASSSFYEGLELVCGSLADDRVTAGGRSMLVREATKGLTNRLRIDEFHRQNSDLASAPVEAPLVILGLPRTGTTALSYLLDCDPQWRSLLNWEAVTSVPPPTTDTLRTDPRCLELLKFQHDVLPIIDPPPPHWEWADGPTECTFLLAQDFKAVMWDTRVPNAAYRDFIETCDMNPAYAHHRRALQVLQSEAPGRWVLKMPAHAYFIDALLATYPDAKIIWAHRDPYRAVASFLDLIGFSHALSLGAPDVEWIRQTYPPRLAEYVRRAEAALAGCDVHHVHFDDLIGDPLATMRSMYGWLGETLDPAVESKMADWIDRDPIRTKRRVPYGLDEWGLERSDLEPLFGDYVRDYDIAVTSSPA